MATTAPKTTTPKSDFDPTKYLQQRGSSTYLPLKWQLAWLRQDYPQAEIRTTLLERKDGLVIFQAEIKLPNGAVATGWGAEAQNIETDNSRLDLSYITLAENMALYRALNILGYGIEYAYDFDPPLDSTPIVLPIAGGLDYEEDEEASIEVPLNIQDTGEALTDDGDGQDTRELGEIRAVYQNAPRLQAVPPLEEQANEPPPAVEKPAVREQTAPAKPANIGGGPQLVDPAIEERLKGVTDNQIRLVVKHTQSPKVVQRKKGEEN
jgi:hypothetical protein